MDLKVVANALVAGCREGREVENLGKLYASDAVSVEAAEQGMPREAKGLDAIRAKHEWWGNAMEVQGKVKDSGETFDMKEIGVYHVKDGKINREEFFYTV